MIPAGFPSNSSSQFPVSFDSILQCRTEICERSSQSSRVRGFLRDDFSWWRTIVVEERCCCGIHGAGVRQWSLWYGGIRLRGCFEICDLGMAAAFKGREDHRKQMELEEARKASVASAEVDEDGKEINFRIPQYMSSAPWCLYGERLSLKNERNWKWDPNYTKDWYDRGKVVFQADKIRKGACLNCGAMTHARKLCMDGPRKTGAKLTKS